MINSQIKQISSLRNLSELLAIFLIAIFTLIVSMASSPALWEQGRDGGFFAVAGQMVSNGAVPYRDFWDEKPPGIFYLQSIAILLFGPTRWAIWVFQSIYLFVTATVVYFAFRIWKERFWSILVAILLLVLARMPAFSEFGDMLTEGYVLLPQAAMLFLVVRYIKRPTQVLAFAIGVAAAGAFLFRQNAISFPLALVPALVLASPRRLTTPSFWFELLFMITGGLVTLGLVMGYLASAGALDEAFTAWRYQPEHRTWRIGEENLGIINGLLAHRFGVFGLVFLNPPLFVSLMLSCLGIALQDWRNHSPAAIEFHLLLWMLLTVMFQLLLTNLSGQAFPHYYILFSISLAVLLVLALFGIGRAEPHWLIITPWLALIAGFIGWIANLGRLDVVVYGAAMVVFGIASWFLTQRSLRFARLFQQLALGGCLLSVGLLVWQFVESAPDNTLTQWINKAVTYPEVEYLTESVAVDDAIFVWGHKAALHFQSQRQPAGSFIYHHAIVTPGYTESLLTEMIADLEVTQPTHIVDTAIAEGSSIVPPLDSAQRASWVSAGGRTDTGDLSEWFDWVNDHCTVEETFGENWIYKCEYE